MTPLKLAALDAQDLQVIAAHLQDAVLRVADIDYSGARKEFAVALNRFAWEAREGSWFRRRHQRRRSVLQFARVVNVRTAGIDRTKPDEVLSLLTVRFIPGEAPGGTVELMFSGGAAIRLDAECIEARLADLGAAWETQSRPVHRA